MKLGDTTANSQIVTPLFFEKMFVPYEVCTHEKISNHILGDNRMPSRAAHARLLHNLFLWNSKEDWFTLLPLSLSVV